jgi:sulfate adenylyltransferase subunit 2
VGTDVFHAAVLLWVAGLAHFVSGNVDLLLMANILLGSVPGVWLGVHLITRVPAGGLRLVLGCVLLAAGLGVLSKSGVDVSPYVLLGSRCLRVAAAARPARAPARGGGARMTPRTLSHLRALEAEAIHVMREVASELEHPVLLFSGGKDSIVLLRLAEKAFRPGPFPFPLMHVDTGHNFPEVIAFRDRRVAELGERLVVASVQDSIDAGRVAEETGPRASRNRLQTITLLDAIEEHGFDAAFGGARRDEERARAKERIFSFRDDFGTWDPKGQRPELWSLYNGRVRRGEHVRVFPLSNWTELDVWQYISEEGLELPPMYFAHEREVFARDGMLYAVSEHVQLIDGEEPFTATVRYRTVGDMSCTGAVRSTAADLQSVVAEIAATRITERGETRADDRVSEAAMEDRKVAGYF